ncbi:MAG: hypothetical protein C5B51_10235, partial [Terriglobia bacterium]
MFGAIFATRGLLGPLLATAVGITAALAGIGLTDSGRRSRTAGRLVPFSAGVLLGVALFGVLPELALEAGWAVSLALFGGGYGLLVFVDRFLYRICPTCAHDHDHSSCDAELHGFAGPLIAAAAVHSFLDGWSIATAQWAAPVGLRVALPIAVALHKIPEGMALGGILRAAVNSKARALQWCIVAEGTTLLGGAFGALMAPRLGTGWILYPLGLTAGWVFYLGWHAV